jgi:hypothetical protein
MIETIKSNLINKQKVLKQRKDLNVKKYQSNLE